MQTRILIFSPYAWRPHLTFYEGTIAKSCQIRGAGVEYLLCDGLLPECDNHWDSFSYNRPRPLDLCQRCQAKAKELLDELNLPYRWLGSFVSLADRKEAFNWAQCMSPGEIRQAFFMDYPLGDWVLSSVISYFRQYPPDMTNWRVVNVYRGFVYSARIVSIGLKNYLEENNVDSALLFNGRQSITRVAFEIFKSLEIPVLTHETPFYQNGHLMLKANGKCWSIEPYLEYWHKWRKVPLERTSLEMTEKMLINRRYGAGLSWYAYNAPQTRRYSIRKELDLSHNKQLIALFTSSTDEIAGDPELQGPYESQAEWVQDVVNWVRDRSDVELIVRVHPHLAGKTGLGKARDEFNIYEKLKGIIPANTRLIMPDDPLNSYALMDEADVCLSFGSSVGIEMGIMGKPVVLASRAIYEEGSHILKINDKSNLSEILERSLQKFSLREIRREAYRMAYYYAFKFEMPFPLVSAVGVMDVKLNYNNLEALAPGRDSTIDQICGHLLHGLPLFNDPKDDELSRSNKDEDDYFDTLENLNEPFRNLRIESRLRSAIWWNQLGRKIQGTVLKMPLGSGNFLNSIGKLIYMPILKLMKKLN
jgi:hypothetical protein